MLAQLSGSFSGFALLARVVPHRLRVWAMARYLGHPEEEKFPTYYDHCYAGALERMLASWSSVMAGPRGFGPVRVRVLCAHDGRARTGDEAT